MIMIETKEIVISEELKRKVEMICRFTNTKPTIKNGSIRSLKGTNIAYVEPHQAIINDIIYFLFDESNKVFINNLDNEIPLSELENHIKTHKTAIK